MTNGIGTKAVAGGIFLAGVSLLLTLLVAELMLRMLSPSASRFYIWPPYVQREFYPDPDAFPGITGSSAFHINSIGLRSDEPDENYDIRILTLGGSTTECLLLDQDEAWPQRLQQRLAESSGLDIWVGNAGRSGHSTREHIYQADQLLKQMPDTDLVVLLAGINDLGLRLIGDQEYDPDYLNAPGIEDRMIPQAFANYPIEYRSGLPFYKGLELYALARRAKDQLIHILGPRSDEQDSTGSNVVRWRKNRTNALALRDELPDMRASLEEYRSNLLKIVEVSRSAGVPLYLLTQPTIWRPDLTEEEVGLLWWGGVGEHQHEGARAEYYSVSALQLGISMYNDVLLSVCANEGMTCLDLAELIPKDKSAFYDEMHFNETGAALVSAHVADFISEKLPVDSIESTDQAIP